MSTWYWLLVFAVLRPLRDESLSLVISGNNRVTRKRTGLGPRKDMAYQRSFMGPKRGDDCIKERAKDDDKRFPVSKI